MTVKQVKQTSKSSWRQIHQTSVSVLSLVCGTVIVDDRSRRYSSWPAPLLSLSTFIQTFGACMFVNK